MTDHDYNPADWLNVEDVADMLQTSIRQAHRYGEEGKIDRRRVGRRVVFSRADVEKMAADLGIVRAVRPPKPPKTEMISVSEFVGHIEKRDAAIAQLQQQLAQSAMTIGALQAQIETRLLPTEARDLERRLIQAETERDVLRREIERLGRPWWRKLFGK